jgi:hypothetical protein
VGTSAFGRGGHVKCAPSCTPACLRQWTATTRRFAAQGATAACIAYLATAPPICRWPPLEPPSGHRTNWLGRWRACCGTRPPSSRRPIG